MNPRNELTRSMKTAGFTDGGAARLARASCGQLPRRLCSQLFRHRLPSSQCCQPLSCVSNEGLMKKKGENHAAKHADVVFLDVNN
jgi:hypothetical protein